MNVWFLLAGLALGLMVLMVARTVQGSVDAWTRPPRVQLADDPARFALAYEAVEFPARDGVILRAWFFDAPLSEASAQSAVIVCHGHGGDKSPHLNLVGWFRPRGLPLLLFDFRNHGASDGTLTSLGYNERLDILGAVDWLVSRGHKRIGLLGYSMGAATAMAAAPLAPQIGCVVSDSGFAQLRPVLERVALRRLPFAPLAHLLIALVWRMAEQRLQCHLDAAEPLSAVSHFGSRPLLLIYGTRDKYVDTWQPRALQQAASGPVDLWLVEGALHTEIDHMLPLEYHERVLGFFARHLQEDRRAATTAR